MLDSFSNELLWIHYCYPMNTITISFFLISMSNCHKIFLIIIVEQLIYLKMTIQNMKDMCVMAWKDDIVYIDIDDLKRLLSKKIFLWVFNSTKWDITWFLVDLKIIERHDKKHRGHNSFFWSYEKLISRTRGDHV